MHYALSDYISDNRNLTKVVRINFNQIPGKLLAIRASHVRVKRHLREASNSIDGRYCVRRLRKNVGNNRKLLFSFNEENT